MTQSIYEMHEVIQFVSVHQGPHLLICGAIHGDEVCGPAAIRKAIAQIQSGEWALTAGTVTFLPVCNPRAYKENKRYCEINLNRVIKPHISPSCYEAKLASNIVVHIDQCDYLLDIHSFHTDGPAFVFQDHADEKTQAFARGLGINYIITGWPELYAGASAGVENDGDTVSYAQEQGKTAVTVECGYHRDSKSIDVALGAIHNALNYLGLTVFGDQNGTHSCKVKVIACTKLVAKKEGVFTKDWHHLDFVRAGETIAITADGKDKTAPYDAYILLPNPKCIVGQEWYYLGVAENEGGV